MFCISRAVSQPRVFERKKRIPRKQGRASDDRDCKDATERTAQRTSKSLLASFRKAELQAQMCAISQACQTVPLPV